MLRTNKKNSLLLMMTLTAVFFLAEIITGYLTNSMALVADSFHMLSDVLSIVIAFLAVHYSARKSKRNTYDWARAEVLGAMANAVFLLALVFTIVVNAIQRLINVEKISNPLVILGVGGAGLAINAFGLIIFGGHAHPHGHSHKDKHNHSHGIKCVVKPLDKSSESESVPADANTPPGSQMNMHAVFLHVLGDALGSVVVIISALIIYFVEDDWRYYVDPVMSLLISVIISWTTIPLLREASMILLQNPPRNIDIAKMKEEVSQVSGVASIHDLHVWQLSGDCIIATVHVILKDDCDFTKIAQQFKKIFHEFDIHSTTIQPEFLAALPESGTVDRSNALSAKPCRCASALQDGTPLDCQLTCIPTVDSRSEVRASDTECMMRCLSDECLSRMCCDGLKTRKSREEDNRKSLKPCDNLGYDEIGNENVHTVQADANNIV